MCPVDEHAWLWCQLLCALLWPQVVTKAGTPVPKSAAVRINAEDPKYVCRAGFKLEKALDHFNIDVTGLTALDSGLSTGGFTHCLLQRGARHVGAQACGCLALSHLQPQSYSLDARLQFPCSPTTSEHTSDLGRAVGHPQSCSCASELRLWCAVTGVRHRCGSWAGHGQHSSGPARDCHGAHQPAAPEARAAARAGKEPGRANRGGSLHLLCTANSVCTTASDCSGCHLPHVQPGRRTRMALLVSQGLVDKVVPSFPSTPDPLPGSSPNSANLLCQLASGCVPHAHDGIMTVLWTHNCYCAGVFGHFGPVLHQCAQGHASTGGCDGPRGTDGGTDQAAV